MLAELLLEHLGTLKPHLFLGYVDANKLIDRLKKAERGRSGSFNDEQVWTFLVACGYAMGGAEGVARLTKNLTGADLPQPDNAKVWFEVLPLPPRIQERNTHLDLAIGTITRRGKTKSGIELEVHPSSWICFCEMKWHSDMSADVKHDPRRNQIVRVIENALYFQANRRYANEVHVALVIPASAKDTAANPLTYVAKFKEYAANHANILEDLKSCVLDKRNGANWTYPADMCERVKSLSLHWHTYNELFSDLPDSAIRGPLEEFWAKYGE